MKRFLTLIMLVALMVPSALRGQTADTVADVYARQLNANEVEVMWSWDKIVPQAVVIDFETGDFSQGDFKNSETFPWEITQDAYEGNYAVKSTNAGNDGTEPFLELTVEVPYDRAVVGFYHRVESEYQYDGGIFYVDGISKASITGIQDWEYVEVPVSAGVHTYAWGYFKDSYGDEGEIGADTYWVDHITPYYPAETIGEGWLYYDDGYFNNAIGMGQAGLDNYWAVSFPDMSEYAGQTLTKVAVCVYQGTNVTATVCLGGTDAPGTVVATQSITAVPGEVVEVNLDTPVAIDGTEPLWIVMHCNDGAYPAAATAYCGNPNGSWFMFEGAWYEVSTLGVDQMTWMIRGFVEDAAGRTVAMSQGEFAPISNVTSDAKVSVFTPERKKILGTPTRANRDQVTYNLYRTNAFLGGEAELILENTTDTSYVDNTWVTAEYGVYQWGVEVVKEGRNANRGDILNLDFENGEMPAGWVVTTSLGYPTLGEWSVRSGFSSYNLSPFGLNGMYSEGVNYNAYHNLITSAIDLTAATAPTLSFYYANPEWLGDVCNLNVKVGSSQEGPWTTIWTSLNSVDELTAVTIDLTEYEGQTIYLNFENDDHYGYGICIDNIVVSGGEGGENPIDPITDKIVWSNPIEKDMYTIVDVNVSLNTDENVKGTEVSFVNTSEPGMGYDYSVELDATGTYTWNEFRRGTYQYTVYKKGYESCATEEVVEILEPESFTCVLNEIIGDVEKLYVSPTGLAMWEGEEVITKGDEFEFDFEDGTTSGWTLIDADGDGYGWSNTNEVLTEPAAYNSQNSIVSASYINNYGALYPDNYIVTAEKYLIGGASRLTFMVSALDPSWSQEHYGVAVSTTGNTSPADFQMVWEETLMTIKNTSRDANAARGQKRSDSWYLKTIDLSEYEGQEVYIALRHFDCTDMYMILIDDVELTNAAKSRAIESYTVSLNGVEEAIVAEKYYQHEDVTPGETYTTTVVANYASGESVPVEYTWTCAACDEFDGISDLSAKHINGNAVLTWTLPESLTSTEELKYDNGENWNYVGLAGYGNIRWAVMFPAEDLTPGTLTKVAMYDGIAHTGDIYVYLGGDTAPSTLMTTQPYECTDVSDYVDFELLEPVTIDGTENLWIVFGNNDESGNIAPVSNNESTANARWISVDGQNWLDVSVAFATTEFSWQIRGYIETGTYPLGVVIYRDGELLTEEIVAEETYSDPMTIAGTYEYSIQVVHSNYAMSCPQTLDFEYDGVSVAENDANAMIVYPNPVKDNLTIAAENMTRVTITNTLGQLMFDEEVANDNKVINVAQYETGVYVVRIATETGVAVERITVIK